MSEKTAEKPSLDDVLKYAREQVGHYISRLASAIPEEHQEEMVQMALVRVWRLYPKMDASRGVKKFVQKHCRGAVLDYMRAGIGFPETKKSLGKGNRGAPTLTRRMSMYCETEDEAIELDRLIGFSIIGTEVEVREMIDINWDLLSRMARRDIGLHIFVRHVLLDKDISELAPIFGVTRERLSQAFQDFLRRIDDPKLVNDPWTNQMIFALGLAKFLGVPNIDQRIGWTYEPVDVKSTEPFNAGDRANQLTMIDSEFSAERKEIQREIKPVQPLSEIEGDDHLQMTFFGQTEVSA